MSKGWSDHKDRWQDLVVKEALSEISEPEKRELERLTKLRRRFFPRTGEEKKLDRKHRARTKRLLEKLHRLTTTSPP